jgi:hypothetical protein
MRFFILVFALFSSAFVYAKAPDNITTANGVVIPRIDKAPPLEAFESMKADGQWEGKLAVIHNFQQRDPQDSQPAISKTTAYLGYDDKNLYVIFVCFDDQPNTVRSRLARRDTIGPEDDEVQVYLDTFNDKRRSYGFMTNPKGIQFDYLWTEENGYDGSFDTVWNSSGKRTAQGWIAIFSIPFKSLRFRTTPEPTWGLLLQRVIPRTNENLFWPQNTHRISGRLNQEGTATGLKNISPGRNYQFIPYVAGRSFRAPDLRDPNNPTFGGAHFKGDAGLDAKMVIKDAFVLDATVNPDFSQVESDEPQVTVNQRFEVFFPEKRPFFLENSDFFNTPINLLFTRRIADPDYGVRLTGKVRRYQLGMLFANDRSPGLSVPDNDPLSGKKAYFGVFRGRREIFKESSIGAIYTRREFEGSHNQVGGLDFHFKWKNNWTAEGQHVQSTTHNLDGTHQNGSSTNLWLDYTDKSKEINTMYIDTTQGFLTETGFFRRPDIRRWSNFSSYQWRPEGKIVTWHGPSMFDEHIWDHSGTRLTNSVNVNYKVALPRQTILGAYINGGHERLKPTDFPVLTEDLDLRSGRQGFFFDSFYFPMLTLHGEWNRGTDFNFVPAANQKPYVALSNNGYLQATVKPFAQLTIDNTYFLTRLREPVTGQSAFNNHIVRSKWNYQFTRELSLRFIAQYDSTLANPAFTSLTTGKHFNADFLITYLLRPGTAVYVGYNTNLSNPNPTFVPGGVGPFQGPQPPNRFINDARGIFVKASYLYRF